MPNPVLDRLCSERDEARAGAIAIAESDDFNPDDRVFTELQTRAESLDTQISRLVELTDQRTAADALDGRISQANRRTDPTGREVEMRSAGQIFTDSDVFRDYRSGRSGTLEVDDDIQRRALPTGISDLVAAGFKGTPFRVDTSAPVAPTPLMDNVSQLAVTTNSIEYIAWSKIAGGAAKVAEKSAKPSAEWAPTVTAATLDTFAVHTQLTRQMMEDFGVVTQIIDQGLRADVAKAEEADAAAVITAATATIPDSISAVDLLSAIRVGIGTVQAAGYEPNAILMNPADWAALDIVVMGATVAGPTVRQSFWGLTPIPSPAQTAGTAIVGDFRSAVHHYYRSAIALYVTDSHASTFLNNVFTLLAERRSKTALVRPLALTECKKSP